MTTNQATALASRAHRPLNQHPKPPRDLQEKTAGPLLEYLEALDTAALIKAAPNPRARLLFLVEWRAEFSLSEALAAEAMIPTFKSPET